MLTIQTNNASLRAQRNLMTTQRGLDKALARLSSGYRINDSADDAAGLAVSENMKGQIRSMKQAERNANDGISMLQIAEGAMSEITDSLIRIRELAMEAANGTWNDTQRGLLQLEVAQRISEIDRLAGETEFNELTLLNGSITSMAIQAGLDGVSATDQITFAMVDMRTATFGTGGAGGTTDISTVTVGTQGGAQATLTSIDSALNSLTGARATLGAVQNRLQVAIDNIRNMHESLSAANSRIRDVDVAEETANLTAKSILMQAGVSVLAQANQVPTMTLNLLQ